MVKGRSRIWARLVAGSLICAALLGWRILSVRFENGWRSVTVESGVWRLAQKFRDVYPSDVVVNRFSWSGGGIDHWYAWQVYFVNESAIDMFLKANEFEVLANADINTFHSVKADWWPNSLSGEVDFYQSVSDARDATVRQCWVSRANRVAHLLVVSGGG